MPSARRARSQLGGDLIGQLERAQGVRHGDQCGDPRLFQRAQDGVIGAAALVGLGDVAHGVVQEHAVEALGPVPDHQPQDGGQGQHRGGEGGSGHALGGPVAHPPSQAGARHGH